MSPRSKNFRQRVRHTSSNPMFTRKTWRHVVIEHFGTFALLSVLTFLVILYIGLYSPVLQIHRVEISGIPDAQAISVRDDMVLWQMQQRRWIIFPQDNLIMFSKNWLRENIGQEFDPQSIQIDKQFPDSINITITEKDPSLVWKTEDQYYYIDPAGIVSAATVSAETGQESFAYPVLIDESNTAVQPGDQALSPDKVAFTAILYQSLSEFTEPSIAHFYTPHQLSPRINVSTHNGYSLYFDSSKSVDGQILKLREIMEKKAADQPPQQYIDLRIGDKVYIK